MNFVEVMALQRAFSGGCFKCSGASTMVTINDFRRQGCDLIGTKNGARKLCFGCLREFIKGPALQIAEAADCVTISSP